MFTEADWAWLEDVSWDLDEVVAEACDFAHILSVIAQSSAKGWNISKLTRNENGRISGFTAVGDIRPVWP